MNPDVTPFSDTSAFRPATVACGVALLAVLCSAGCAPRQSTGGVSVTTATPATPTVAATSSAAATPAPPPPISPTAPWTAPRLVRRWSGLTQPLYLTALHDGSGRVFIVEKTGRVRIGDRNGRVERTPLLDISDRVSNGGEQGLLSIAVPPGSGAPARIYACYTATNGDVIVARYPVRGGVAVSSAEKIVLRVPHHTFTNHNGGQIQFGPEGYLYLGVGDGGSEGDPNHNGENTSLLLSKLLRIDVEGVSTPGHKLPSTYVVPPDNPFVHRRGFRPEIWAYGLRNPWRFSFDASSGQLYIGDVGQNLWEEIDVAPAGKGGQDYGWSRFEGLHTYPPGSSQDARGVTFPVAEYGHDVGNAVIGGYVYRGTRYPAMAGVYFFSDNGSGRIWGLRHAGGRWQMKQLANTGLSPGGFGVDGTGELYLCDLGGDVYQLTAR